MSHTNTSIYVSTFWCTYPNIKSLSSIRAYEVSSNVISIYINCLSKRGLSEEQKFQFLFCHLLPVCLVPETILIIKHYTPVIK